MSTREAKQSGAAPTLAESTFFVEAQARAYDLYEHLLTLSSTPGELDAAQLERRAKVQAAYGREFAEEKPSDAQKEFARYRYYELFLAEFEQ